MCKQGIVIHPEELTDRMIQMLRNTNLNVLGLHPVGGKSAHQSLEEFLKLVSTEGFQKKIDQVRAMGIAVEYEIHALSWMLPRDMHVEHPEWFRMDENGERVNDFNLCASNAEALEHISSRAAELATLIPSDTGRYYFWVDDVKHACCHCERCKQLSPSDQALAIYNAILRGIRRVDKNAKQCYLAYQETMEVPQKIKPDEGIFLEYAPMFRNTKVPMNDENCEENQKFLQAIIPLLNYFGTKEAQALEYWLDNSLFSGWKKPPKYMEICTETICKDIQFYRECGFEGITTFGCYLSEDYIELYGEPPIKEYAECFASKRA